MNFTLRLPEALWKRLKIAAMNDKRSMKEIIVEAIEAHLKARKAAANG